MNVTTDQEPILVIDDEQPFLDMFQKWGSEWGYTIFIFNTKDLSKKEVYEKVFGQINSIGNLSLIIIDQQLGSLEGTDLAKELIQHFNASKIPIILTTQYFLDDAIRRALSAGFIHDFLPKPVDKSAALARIKIIQNLAKTDEERYILKSEALKQWEQREQLEELFTLLSLGMEPHLIRNIFDQLTKNETFGPSYDVHADRFYITLLEFVCLRKPPASMEKIIEEVQSFPSSSLPPEISNINEVINELRTQQGSPIKSTIKFLINHLGKSIGNQITFYESLLGKNIVVLMPVPPHIIENLILSKCELILISEGKEIPRHLEKQKMRIIDLSDIQEANEVVQSAHTLIAEAFKTDSGEIRMDKSLYMNFINRQHNINIGIHIPPHEPRWPHGWIKYDIRSAPKIVFMG